MMRPLTIVGSWRQQQIKPRYVITGILLSIILVQYLDIFYTSCSENRVDLSLNQVARNQHAADVPTEASFDRSNRTEPAYWIEDKEDDYYERIYTEAAPLTQLRQNLSLRHYFPPVCGLYRFNTSLLPTVSVIMTLRNEMPDMVSLTAHSILARTPPELLVEVIIINDSDDKHSPELKVLEQVSPKVLIIPTTQREGCARSRMIGARHARGEVLMFVDSHIEMLSSTWYQHLALPIVENPHTISSQKLQQMSDLEGHYYTDKKSRSSQFGSMDDHFLFVYQKYRFPDTPYQESPSPHHPYEMPFGPGALFAILKNEFWRLGGYDEGIYVWGAENMELSLKIWMCGGRLVQVPCSQTGHMYRFHHANKWRDDDFGNLEQTLGFNEPGEYRAYGNQKNISTINKILIRNSIRVATVWLGEARRYYYQDIFGSKYLSPEWLKYEEEDEDMRIQLQHKEQNQCHDFEWFDRHVMMRLLGTHQPWYKKMKMDAYVRPKQQKQRVVKTFKVKVGS